ncbi:hypothetical protein QA640_12625 [Bradyrhizobium sp. CB82]|uniref:hypothetical protein n=1 Tax=Bradyrhizobium sp. CB82 TaxID=3039159 RepID=UPI0024B20D8D|nr:hypothetical protein [Bradyrhizobium sp. CB82]WFU43213.1 hypothetical protein QA640_12625 [Bradyrhizobium sp. CB82]
MLEAVPSSLDVPYGADQTLFVVIDQIGGAREIRIERADLDQAIGEFIAGCFSDPVRVISFNTLEHWVKDISADVALEIQSRCDIEGTDLPDHLRDFVERHICASSCSSPGLHAALRAQLAAR